MIRNINQNRTTVKNNVPTVFRLIFLATTFFGTLQYNSKANALVAVVPPKQPNQSFWMRFDRWLNTLQQKNHPPNTLLDKNVYLTGNYAPVQEEHTYVPCQVLDGELPLALHGMLCRSGPNPTPLLSKHADYHWFDGHAMVHNLRFDAGKAFYTNQYVPSLSYALENDIGDDLFPTLGEINGWIEDGWFLGLTKALVRKTVLIGLIGYDYDIKSAPPNSNVLMYNDKFYCLSEANVPFECILRKDGRLEPVGFEHFPQDGQDTLDYPFSAHPIIDPWTGDLLFHGYSTIGTMIERDGPVKVGRLSRQTNRIEQYFGPLHDGTSKSTVVPFVHSLLSTKNYMIIYDGSVAFDLYAVFKGESMFQRQPGATLRFGLISRDASKPEDVLWIDTDIVGTILHPLNAWEDDEDGTITIWTPTSENLDLGKFNSDTNKPVYHMREIRLDPQHKTMISQRVVDDSVRVEDCVCTTMGEKTRFGYTGIQENEITEGVGEFKGFCIWDMQQGRLAKIHRYHDISTTCGPPMVLTTTSASEEHHHYHDANKQQTTYIGVYVKEQDNDKSFFDIFDGETADRVARLQIPARVPNGFHGTFITESELEGHWKHFGIDRT